MGGKVGSSLGFGLAFAGSTFTWQSGQVIQSGFINLMDRGVVASVNVGLGCCRASDVGGGDASVGTSMLPTTLVTSCARSTPEPTLELIWERGGRLCRSPRPSLPAAPSSSSSVASMFGPTRPRPTPSNLGRHDRTQMAGNVLKVIILGTNWGIDATWRHSKLQSKRYVNCNTTNDKFPATLCWSAV